MADIEKSFYLDKNSFALLFTGMGINSLQCFDVFGKEINVDDASACITLHSLVQEGIVKVFDDEFELDSDLDYMLDTIISSKNRIAVYSNCKNISNIAFYINENTAVSVEQDTGRNNYVKLSSSSSKNVFEIITQRYLENLQNDVSVEYIPYTNDIYLNSLSFLNVNDNFEKIISSDDTYLFFDFISSAKQRSCCKIALIMSKSGPVIFEWKRNYVHSQFYTYKDLYDIFNQCLEEQ